MSWIDYLWLFGIFGIGPVLSLGCFRYAFNAWRER